MTKICTELVRRDGHLMVKVYTKPFQDGEVLNDLIEAVFSSEVDDYALEKKRFLLCGVDYIGQIHDWVLSTRHAHNLVDPFVREYLEKNPPLELPPVSETELAEMAPLREHQAQVVKAVLGLPFPRALLALDQGLGKTLTALSIARRWSSAGRVLVVCPATLRKNWMEEIKRWFGVDQTVFVATDVKKTTTADLLSCQYNVCSYAFLRLCTCALPKYSTVIFDEAHNIKTYSSTQTKKARRVIDDTRRVLFLTGTPIPNNHTEAYTMLKALVHHPAYYNFTKFKMRYCDYKFNPLFGGYDAKASDCPEELSLMLGARMARIIKAEIAIELPAKKRFEIVLPNDNETVRRLTRVIRDQQASAAVVAECFQAIAATKVSQVVMYIVKYLVENPSTGNIVVFYHHKGVGDKLQEALTDIRGGLFRIDGMTPAKKRQDIINDFIASERGIALLTIGTCSTGLNMPSIKTVFFAELNFVPANLMQCEDRFHRLTSVGDDVMYHYLVLEDSCDQHILTVLRRKDRVIRKLYSVESRDRKRIKLEPDDLRVA